MRNRKTAMFLSTLFLLTACSAYHKQDAEAGRGPEIQVVETLPSMEEGPTLPPEDKQKETIEELTIPEQTKETMNPEIILATDIHYLAKELTDFGQAFVEMAELGDGKLVPYVWEITDAFLDEVIARKPQALLLTGDLTLEGELASHEALAQKLERVAAAGIPVMVIPGNHDLNNSKAAEYKENGSLPAVKTTPEEFRTIYADYGYDDAISCDPASLSYVGELKDGTWILMLDSCQYENGALVGGMIRLETYEWIDKVMEQAWEEDRRVIAVAHHNLLDESRIYEEDCTIEHAEELKEKLAGWGISLFLSGHLHVQHYRYTEDYDIQEIVTASLSTSPCMYGVLKYFENNEFDYHTEKVDVSTWARKKGNPDINLQNFENYADEFLQQVFYNKAWADLQRYSLSTEERTIMAELYALLNVYAVAGRAQEIRDHSMALPAYELWQEYSRTDILCMYLNEILEDAVCNYNVLRRP